MQRKAIKLPGHKAVGKSLIGRGVSQSGDEGMAIGWPQRTAPSVEGAVGRRAINNSVLLMQVSLLGGCDVEAHQCTLFQVHVLLVLEGGLAFSSRGAGECGAFERDDGHVENLER